MTRGSVRRGETLLAGLLCCGHCGRKLHVAYRGTIGQVVRSHCQGSFLNHGGDRGISFGSLRVDAAAGAEVVRLMKPFGVAAARGAIARRTSEAADKRRQLDLALKQQRFEAAHTRWQYDGVDPHNRLVASELERRWNDRLRLGKLAGADLRRIGLDEASIRLRQVETKHVQLDPHAADAADAADAFAEIDPLAWPGGWASGTKTSRDPVRARPR